MVMAAAKAVAIAAADIVLTLLIEISLGWRLHPAADLQPCAKPALKSQLTFPDIASRSREPGREHIAPRGAQHCGQREVRRGKQKFLQMISLANLAMYHAKEYPAVMSDQNSQKPVAGLTYADAGVDIDAGNAMVNQIKPLVRATRRPGSDSEIGGFGGLFDLKAAGFHDPILVAANDGVGTKVKIAIEIGIHDTVGIDLVAMCVNDLVVQGAEPLFFLDYYATGKLDPQAGAAIVKGIADGCIQAGCALIGGETAEMPGLYSGADYDLAGFAVGAAERGTLLPKADIQAGDVLLGLGSSGVHSNGFSLVRRVVERTGLQWDDPCPYMDELSLGAALLIPTRIYVKSLLAAIRQTGAVKGLAHITGGGFPENIPRILPDSLAATLDLTAIQVPPVFSWLAREGSIAPVEMMRTFNCGIGMIVVTAPSDAAQVEKYLQDQGETVFRIGSLTERTGAAVTYSGKLGL